jgi:NAD+ kinase
LKIALVGRHSADLKPLVLELGFDVVDDPKQAETIVAYGGDGTVIGAEHTYPGIPKLGLRDGKVVQKCDKHADRDVLARLARGEATVARLMKIELTVHGRSVWGLNDALLRNSDVRSAVRFQVFVNDDAVSDEIIGDGLVVATPFGSSAYFRSITNTTFREGIGIAFNNCTDFGNHVIVQAHDKIRVEIIRGPAQVTCDNNPTIESVGAHDHIAIQRAKEFATIHAPDTLRCSRCRYSNAPRRRF